jgi:two-component system response regulator NreC
MGTKAACQGTYGQKCSQNMNTANSPVEVSETTAAGPSKPVRVLIADDHEMIRLGARSLLERDPELEVCGEASNGVEAAAMAEKLQPDIMIVDLSMPELNGLDAIRKIKRTSRRTEFLVLSAHAPDELVHKIFEAGARAYINKADAADQLIPAIKTLAQHKPFITPHVSELLFHRFFAADHAAREAGAGEEALTPREREIVQLLAEGKSNKDVSEKLGISVKTAETHRAAVMRKLHLANFSDLVRFAIRNKMIEA